MGVAGWSQAPQKYSGRLGNGQQFLDIFFFRAKAVDFITPVDYIMHSLATFVTSDSAAGQINIFDSVSMHLN